jgi:hypothetical protein
MGSFIASPGEGLMPLPAWFVQTTSGLRKPRQSIVNFL